MLFFKIYPLRQSDLICIAYTMLLFFYINWLLIYSVYGNNVYTNLIENGNNFNKLSKSLENIIVNQLKFSSLSICIIKQSLANSNHYQSSILNDLLKSTSNQLIPNQIEESNTIFRNNDTTSLRNNFFIIFINNYQSFRYCV